MRQKRICKHCGAEFLTPYRRGRRPDYCSRLCKHRAQFSRNRERTRPRFSNCLNCGKEFPQPSRGRLRTYCSRRCWYMAHGGSGWQLADSRVVPCPTCGTRFTQQVPQHRFCSQKCRSAYHHARREPDPSRSGCPRIRAARRALARLGLSVEDLVRYQKGRCPICHRPLSGEASIDHIVPISAGGRHEVANLQITHLHCNLSKNKYGPGQPRLFEVGLS